jgi:hypothetical protein
LHGPWSAGAKAEHDSAFLAIRFFTRASHLSSFVPLREWQKVLCCVLAISMLCRVQVWLKWLQDGGRFFSGCWNLSTEFFFHRSKPQIHHHILSSRFTVVIYNTNDLLGHGRSEDVLNKWKREGDFRLSFCYIEAGLSTKFRTMNYPALFLLF